MYEVWTPSLSGIYAPIAWFNDEASALEYAEHLASMGKTCDVHYNETATMPYWNYEVDWMHV